MRKTLIVFGIFVLACFMIAPFIEGAKPSLPSTEPTEPLGELTLSEVQLAVTPSSDSYVRLYDWNADTDIWDHVWSANCGTGVHGVVIGDIDGDGFDELVVSCSTSVKIDRKTTQTYYYLNIWESGDDSSGDGPSVTISTSVYGHLSLGDVDGDGINELVVSRSGSIYIWDIYDAAGFTDPITYTYSANTGHGWNVKVGDADNDGIDEVLATGGSDEGKIAFIDYSNDEYTLSYFGTKSISVSIDDIDGDGMNEVFYIGNYDLMAYVYRWDDTDGFVNVWEGSYEGTVPDMKNKVTRNIASLAIVDLDGDGTCEVVGAEILGNDVVGKTTTWHSRIYVWSNDGDDSWVLNYADYSAKGNAGEVWGTMRYNVMTSGYPDGDKGIVVWEGSTIVGYTDDNGNLKGKFLDQVIQPRPYYVSMG